MKFLIDMSLAVVVMSQSMEMTSLFQTPMEPTTDD
jgi:hypothetical protein